MELQEHTHTHTPVFEEKHISHMTHPASRPTNVIAEHYLLLFNTVSNLNVLVGTHQSSGITL